jgi:flagellar biosynthesis/type III secretory pathway protein FliH
MTSGAIISAENGSGQAVVQRFLWRGEAQADVVATASKRSVVADLMETLALRDADIANHQDALVAAYAQGEASGRAAAEDAFEDQRETALAALKGGVLSARDALAHALKDFEALAILVATEAVDKLTGNPDCYRNMLTDAIAMQVRSVKDAGIISVTVSRSDFPDTSEIARLETSLGAAREMLSVSDDLEPGACTIELTLGDAENSLTRQWDMMKTLLAALATEGAPVL